MLRIVAALTIATIGAAALGTVLAAPPASAQVLERIRTSGIVKVGHRTDAPPFSFAGADGVPQGYSVELCRRIAEAIGEEAGREVKVEFVPVTTEDRFRAIVEGRTDMSCGADTESLGRREEVSFSIPIFATGISALLRADAPETLREILGGEPASLPPRLSVVQAFDHRTFGVRSGTTAETWLNGALGRLSSNAEVVTVPDHADGIAGVADGTLDAYFADRALLLGQLQQTEDPDRFVITERFFTLEPYAIALPRDDEDLRLAVDGALSRFFRSGAYLPLYEQYFGTPSDIEGLALQLGSLPD